MYWIRLSNDLFINLAICTDAIRGRAKCFEHPEKSGRRFDPDEALIPAMQNEGWKRCSKDVHKLTLTNIGTDPGGKPRRIILYDEMAVACMQHLETLNQLEATK